MHISDFIQKRKVLHQNPELSGMEFQTQVYIRQLISQFNPSAITEVGTTGLLIRYDGKQAGKTVLVRAELDALPITEINTFDHKSKHEAISHKCGHDGHMIILSRLAWLLSQNPPDEGTVYLLFQPAEENGMGARAVLNDPAFETIRPDAVLALHNMPGYPEGLVILRSGTFTPAVRSPIISFHGKTSHAAEPELGGNPAEAMSRLTLEALQLSQPDTSRDDFFLVTPVYTTMGSPSYGVSAGYGEVHLTIRSWENQLLKERSATIEALAEKAGKDYGIDVKTDWTQEFAANNNHPEIVELIRQVAIQQGRPVYDLPAPVKWGEDFGLFTEHFKGAMFGLGAGTGCPALHNPDYDFPDNLIEAGSDLFDQIARNFLKI
ncbi:MAG: amidohydrolase [Taibaiella sp.]|nr:amidohydrolase [Taibaiella sp.]